MKLENFVCALALLPAPALAEDPGSVHALISCFNRTLAAKDSEAFSKLFTADADLRGLSGKTHQGRAEIAAAVTDGRIWTEITPPRFEDESIRFVTPAVALVDGHLVQYGSLALKQTVPVTLVLRDHSGEWKIASMRVLGPCRTAVPLGLTRRRD